LEATLNKILLGANLVLGKLDGFGIWVLDVSLLADSKEKENIFSGFFPRLDLISCVLCLVVIFIVLVIA